MNNCLNCLFHYKREVHLCAIDDEEISDERFKKGCGAWKKEND